MAIVARRVVPERVTRRGLEFESVVHVARGVVVRKSAVLCQNHPDAELPVRGRVVRKGDVCGVGNEHPQGRVADILVLDAHIGAVHDDHLACARRDASARDVLPVVDGLTVHRVVRVDCVGVQNREVEPHQEYAGADHGVALNGRVA